MKTHKKTTAQPLTDLERSETARRQAEELLRQRFAYERAIAECIGILSESGDIGNRLARVLDVLRKLVGASRAYIFVNQDDPDVGLCMTRLYESCADGVTPHVDNLELDHLPYSVGAPALLATLLARKPYAHVVAEMTSPERELVISLDILSVLIVPIFAGDDLWGFIGFDDCFRPRRWQDDNVRILQIIADASGTAILRWEAAQSLVFDRAQLLSIFDGIDASIYVADPETHEVLYVNRALEETFGKELVGEVCYQAFQGLDAPCEFCTNEIILKHKPSPYRWEYHNPILDRDYAIIDRIIKWPDGRDVRFEIATDVTTRKRAEGTLQRLYETSRALASSREQDEIIRTILQAVDRTLGCEHVLFATVDEQARTIGIRHGIWHGQFDLFPEWIELSQYSLDEKDIFTDIVRSAKIEIIGEWDDRFNRTIWTKFGHERLVRVFMPIKMQDRVIGVVEVAYDRRNKERIDQFEISTLSAFMDQLAIALENIRLFAETRQRAARLQTLINSLPEGVLLLDSDDRVILSNPVGDEMLSWLGAATDAPLGQLGPYTLDDLLHADLAAPCATTIPETAKTLEMSAYAIESPQEENRGMLVLLRDVTELRQAQELAHQRDRLATVGRLAGGVAHDFNNILTVVTGYTDFVRDSLSSDNPLDWPPGAELRADLGQVSLAAHRAAALTRQLLIFSRKETIETQVFDLNTLVSNMAKMLTRLIGEDVTLNISLSQTTALIEADPGRIEQVVMNLAVNARDAMPHGGSLTIETAHVEWKTPHTLSHSQAGPGSYVRLAVKDEGIGMSKPVLGHLFEPFFTTKAPGQGTGFGLAMVYGIVQQNNGHINVHSQPGRGATFDIYFPCAAGATHTALPEQHLEAIPDGRETILLVEDEDGVRNLTRRVLEQHGYTVLSARGPGEALLLSERYQGPIDLLLTDVVMPEMNGQALAAQIVAQRAGIKILFMSGYTGDIVGRYGIHLDDDNQMNATNLLQKPFEASALARLVRQALGEPAIETVASFLSAETTFQPAETSVEWSGTLRMLQALQPGDQLCFIYRDETECRAVIEPFVQQGLAQRHQVLYLADGRAGQAMTRCLQHGGVDVEAILAAGQLSIWSGVQAADREDAMTPAALAALLQAEAEKSRAEGYAALRVICEMTWVRQLCTYDGQLREFEIQVQGIRSGTPILVICQYDRRQFDARALLDVLRTHPRVLVNAQIYDNIYYIDPAQHSSSEQAEITLDRWLANLESYRQAADVIRQSEQKLRGFVEQSDDAIVLTDEQGRIVEWNRGAEQVYGIGRSMALSRMLWDVQFDAFPAEQKTPKAYARLKKSLRDAIKTGWVAGLNALREVEIQRPDGARKVLQMLAFAIQTEQGFILANTARDITDFKRAQASLLKSEARYRSLIEHIPAIIHETPFGESSSSFYAGPQIERILGFEQKEWAESSKLWLRQIHPDDRVRVLTALAKSQDSGEPFSAEYRLISRDGNPVWFHDEAVIVRDDEGNPLFLHGIMLEINERKQAEDNLRRYAMHLALLNELGQQIAAELDVDRVLTRAVSLVRTSFGYHHVGLFILDREQNELVMRANAGSYVKLFPPGHRLRMGQGMVGWVGLHGERRLANDVRQEEQYVNPYPELIPTQSELAVPIRTGNETVGVLDVQSPDLDAFGEDDILVLETLADQIAVAIKNAYLYAALVEERAGLAQRVQERTAELSLANAELARAARLKDEFLANMSHELRTPLNAILGLSEAVLEGVYGPLTGRQQKSLHSIGEAGHHLLSLVNDILDVAKAQAGKLELQIGVVSINGLCQSSLGLVRQMAHQKGIQLLPEIDEQVTSIEGDPRRLKQVLVNLLSNAVKFTPQGGKVGLKVTGDPARETVHLTVWDSGIGISDQDLGRLFQPFVQLDAGLSRQYAGTGLGLALVRRLVELHGGGIAVESEVGQGSRFTVSLPWPAPAVAVDSAATRPADEQTTLAVRRSPGVKAPLVLLAEDNPTSMTMFQNYLLVKGYRVVSACNGVKAIEQAYEQRPDLILMDIQMPEMDGLTAIRRLRDDIELSGIPIIALTALAMPGDRERCIRAGADDYLSKPVALKQLLKAIEELLKAKGDAGGTGKT